MKIRLDYVSNSSSSSFMIVGNPYEQDEVITAAKRLGFKPIPYGEEPKDTIPDDEEIDDEEIDDEDFDMWEVMEWLEDKYGLRYHGGISEYGEDTWCVGLEWDDMKGDETKNQFIARVGDLLERVFGTRPQVQEMVDGGMEC